MSLIDADALVKRLKQWDRNDHTDKALYNFAMNRIIEQPTVDAVPVVRGEWILAFSEEENVWKCSVCDKYWLLNNGTPLCNDELVSERLL